jgi:hypothetical protein
MAITTLDILLTISIILRLTALFILGFLVIPKQLKELKEPNNLLKLKKLLLTVVGGIFLTATIPLFINVCRVTYILPDCVTNNYIIGTLAIVFAFNTLLIAIVLYLIYHTSYNKNGGK